MRGGSVGLRQRKFIISQLWRLEVQNQGVSWVGALRGLRKEFVQGPSRSFWWFAGNLWLSLACRQMYHPNLCLHVPGILPVCGCVQTSSFYRDTVILDEGPTLVQHDLILLHLPQPSFQIKSHSEILEGARILALF